MSKSVFPLTQTVELGEEKIVVSKLPLGKYAQLVLALKNMPKGVVAELSSIDTSDNDATLQSLLGLIGEAWGQIIEVLAIGTGMDKERLENDPSIGLDGGVALFVAVYEVNNLQGVISNVKNVFNRPKA